MKRIENEINNISTENIQKEIDEMKQNINERIDVLEEKINENNSHDKIEIINKTREDYNLTEDEMKQLEDWTSLKCGDILFDSDIDNWAINTSEFNDLLFGKKQLTFLIEEEDGEKFGYYLNTEMIERYTKEIQTDRKSFEFNLQSNGRLNGMIKFQIRNINAGIWLFGKSDELLITIGDIVLSKEDKKCESWFYQSNDNFHYHDIENPVCSKRGLSFPFTIKRLIVIQMINNNDL